ncbi:hypothetical protein [Caulobacter sp. FWC2]|uniref:hypothetical protein n=1 Tax=Caulobacter sp. FWC2 TaxID=69664 RepID=UPI000C150620|nr:hypothetical protein [Caulobacter sp. FWC2]PIB91292.1 hypothetical protein CSW62_06705 [Caulobacter sp. FWC2]
MPVGGAILGSAVVGAGASAYASSKAAKASQSATDATLQANREALATQQANTAVARAQGDAALGQLGDRLGVNAPAGPKAGDQNWTAYLAAHPDVAAAVKDPNGGFNGATEAERAADHFSRYGQAAGYSVPAYTAEEAASAAPKTDVQLSDAAKVGTYTRPADQAAPAAYTPDTYTGQEYKAPTYAATSYAAGDYTRPDYNPKLDVSLEAFKSSPEYQAALYDINRQSGAAASALAATGGLQSGAALKRLQEIGQDNTVKYYGDYRDFTTGQYNTDRNRSDSNFNYDTGLKSSNALNYDQLNAQQRQAYDQLNSGNALNYAQLNSGNKLNYDQLNSGNKQNAATMARSDYQYGQGRADQNFNTDRAYGTDLALNNRTYETGRYDVGTNNLFNLANIGQGAAAQTNTAVQNGVNTTSNALFSNAANQGNAALSSASNLNGLLSTGVNALSYYNGLKAPAAARTGAYGPSV